MPRSAAFSIGACAVLATCILPTHAGAQTTISWNNPAGGSYATASNWNPANVPNLTTESARFNLSATMTVSFAANSSTTIGDLEISDGDILFRNAGVNNDATLSPAGHATLHGAKLTLGRLVGGTADVNLNIGKVLFVEDLAELAITDSAIVSTDQLQINEGGLLEVVDAGSMLNVVNGTSAAIIGASGMGALRVTDAGEAHFAHEVALGAAGGTSGQGVLEILSGGIVQSGSLNVGTGALSRQSGIVTIGGGGSNLTLLGAAGAQIGAGANSTGTLVIDAGGSFTSGIGGTTVHPTGLLDINGGAAQLNGITAIDGQGMVRGGGTAQGPRTDIGSVVGSNGSLTITESSNWNVNGLLSIGRSGAGSLLISDGGTLMTVATEFDFGGSGATATITGGDSNWTNSGGSFVLGRNGNSYLEVLDGASLQTDAAEISSGVGTGEALVDGQGSTWTANGELAVGNTGDADLQVANGATLTSTSGLLGKQPGAIGNAHITGRDGEGNPSSWVNTGMLSVGGKQGTAAAGSICTLTIEDGGFVSNTQGDIGGASGATGSVIVRGEGSLWANSEALVVGVFGDGTLLVEDHGTVISDDGYIGGPGGATSEATITGEGAAWTNNGILRVGAVSAGLLRVTGGGSVSSASGMIAETGGSSGDARISGTDAMGNPSTWVNSGSLYVGGRADFAGGDGTLTVETDGVVEVGGTLKTWNSGAVRLLGGTITTHDVDLADSSFDFIIGTVDVTGDRPITNDLYKKFLGPSQTVSSGQVLRTAGVTTLTEPLVLDGGTLGVGQLVNPALLDLKRGKLHIMNQPLVIEAAGLFGDRLQMKQDLEIHISQGITNHGLIYGSGMMGGPLDNAGEIRADAGHTLTFSGPVAQSSGEVRLLGGTVDFAGQLTNLPAGRITGRGTVATGSLRNEGHIAISSGITDIYGDVVNDTQDAAVGITVSGNADATFWDDVENTSGLLRASANSSITFFGALSGNGVSGPGDVYLEADISPGASPGLAQFGGNLHLGSLAILQLELAGTARGSEYDAVDVAGSLSLGGTLEVSLLSFVPAAGDNFELVHAAGGIAGSFSQLVLPTLESGLDWSLTYSPTGVVLAVAVTALPGDYNADGLVDAADYVVWRRTDGTAQGYATWRANFGNGAGAGGAGHAVPEPATALALLAFAWSVVIRRSGHRKN